MKSSKVAEAFGKVDEVLSETNEGNVEAMVSRQNEKKVDDPIAKVMASRLRERRLTKAIIETLA